jgi:hypothetical protein
MSGRASSSISIGCLIQVKTRSQLNVFGSFRSGKTDTLTVTRLLGVRPCRDRFSDSINLKPSKGRTQYWTSP